LFSPDIHWRLTVCTVFTKDERWTPLTNSRRRSTQLQLPSDCSPGLHNHTFIPANSFSNPVTGSRPNFVFCCSLNDPGWGLGNRDIVAYRAVTMQQPQKGEYTREISRHHLGKHSPAETNSGTVGKGSSLRGPCRGVIDNWRDEVSSVP
jgi:hypothetical protein